MGNSICHEVQEDCKSNQIDFFNYKIKKKYSNLAIFHSKIYFLDYSNVICIENPIMELDINCKYDENHHFNFNKKIIKQKFSFPITEYNLIDWIFDIILDKLYQMNLDISLLYIENNDIVIKKYSDKPHYTCVINLVKK